MCFKKQVKAVCAITINKNRLKQKSGPNDRSIIYMNDKQEFQLEFFNPSTKSVMAKIKFNGEYISSRGIVIRPGERVYLDRYIDEARKFIFETYTVGKSKSVEEAIAKNGLIDIDFFEEEENKITTTITTTNGWDVQDWFNGGTYTQLNTFTTNSGTAIGGNNMLTNTSTAFMDTNAGNLSNTVNYSSTPTGSLNSGIVDKVNFNRKLTKSMKRSKETGRVGKGSASNQDFKTVENVFNSFSDYTIKLHIIPLSENPVNSDDLKTPRYCSQCGTRSKPTDKFCSQCGVKL